MKLKRYLYSGIAASALLFTTACSEEYLNTEPNAYLEEEAVSDVMKEDPSQVAAYVTGAYMDLYCGDKYWMSHDDFGLPAIKLATDLFCEDIAYTNDAHFFCYDYQLDNRLGNYRRTGSTWNQLYSVIDKTNTIITMLKPNEGEEVLESAAVMLGEAYSLRAYCYFWLINLWQHPYSVSSEALGVPLKTEEGYRQERVPVGEVYAQILKDIDLGYNYLKGKGYHNQKIGLSEYASAAIYSNILMFTGDYEDAARYAEEAIKGGSLNSQNDMLSGFNSLDMPEAIWGYNVTEETTGYYASLFSHIDSYMIGYGGQVGFRKMIASDLYDKIADTDVRKQWFGLNSNNNLLGIVYEFEVAYGLEKYIQNKYRDVYLTSMGAASPFTSAIIYFRTGEMYFVAAEAYYLAGNETRAMELLNEIMTTRNPEYSFSGTGQVLYDEICLQKRIETWMEGSRCLDAKRRGETIDRSKSSNHAADLEHFNAITYSAHDYRMIYRIPQKELENNPAITADSDNQ